MKVYGDTVKLDEQTSREIKEIMDELSVSITLYSKFQEIWGRLKIADKTLNRESSERMKAMAWLIFITAKSKLLLLV